MKEDIFNFEDFLNMDESSIRKEKLQESTRDSKIEIEEEEVGEEDVEVVEEDTPTPEVKREEESPILEKKKIEENNYYKIYKDRSEEFSCEMSIEGADQNEAKSRLIIESDDWTLMFDGEIKNGKCIIPIKKLSILNEGQKGTIRLEVIAEGNIFVPWEDTFEVKLSKKVTVKVNEQIELPKKPEGVRVSIKR